jgi:hypothetical protein
VRDDLLDALAAWMDETVGSKGRGEPLGPE